MDSEVSFKEKVMELLSNSNDGRAVNVTKTALTKLKVNQLRELLDAVGSDVRGNKGALVDRILALIKQDDENSELFDIVERLGDGPVDRKNVARMTRLKHKEKEQGPITEAQLAAMQTSTESSLNLFSKVFSSPHEVARLLVDAKADDVVIIDVSGRCAFTDYMVIASGRSHQLVHMLASATLHELKQRCKEVAPEVSPVIEGKDDPNPEWLVVDAGSVVIHIFHEDSRREYDLEGLWGNADTITRVAMPYSVETLRTITA